MSRRRGGWRDVGLGMGCGTPTLRADIINFFEVSNRSGGYDDRCTEGS